MCERVPATRIDANQLDHTCPEKLLVGESVGRRMWTVHVRDNGGRFPVTAKSKGMWLPVRPPGCRWKGIIVKLLPCG